MSNQANLLSICLIRETVGKNKFLDSKSGWSQFAPDNNGNLVNTGNLVILNIMLSSKSNRTTSAWHTIIEESVTRLLWLRVVDTYEWIYQRSSMNMADVTKSLYDVHNITIYHWWSNMKKNYVEGKTDRKDP